MKPGTIRAYWPLSIEEYLISDDEAAEGLVALKIVVSQSREAAVTVKHFRAYISWNGLIPIFAAADSVTDSSKAWWWGMGVGL